MLLKFRKSNLHIVLFHPLKAKVLVVSKNDDYFLPRLKIRRLIDLQNNQQRINSYLGIKVNILQRFYANKADKKGASSSNIIYILEQQNSGDQVQIGSWCDLSNLTTLSFIDPDQKSLVEQYLIELETGNVSSLRPPWAQSGWFNKVSVWIEEQMCSRGLKRNAPIEYVKNTPLSIVLRIRSKTETLYFKEICTSPLFCNEPRVTAELANLFSEHIPNVVGYNDNWMLLQDFGNPIGRRGSKTTQDVYSKFAQMQIKSIGHRDFLLQIGCSDRRLEILQSQIAPLLKDENIICNLTDTETEQLHALKPHLENLCDRLASYNIPETLVHGDLHLGNVALNEGNYLFFDWTDACIAHPFFDYCRNEIIMGRKNSLLFYIHRFWNSLGKKRLRNQYLSHWLKYESKERLQEACNIAKVLYCVHVAITYKAIFDSLEPKLKAQYVQDLAILPRMILANFEAN